MYTPPRSAVVGIATPPARPKARACGRKSAVVRGPEVSVGADPAARIRAYVVLIRQILSSECSAGVLASRKPWSRRFRLSCAADQTAASIGYKSAGFIGSLEFFIGVRFSRARLRVVVALRHGAGARSASRRSRCALSFWERERVRVSRPALTRESPSWQMTSN